MRISLFLNSTMSKSCAQSRKKEWFQEEQKPHITQPGHYSKTPHPYKACSSKQASSFHPRLSQSSVSRLRQLPAFLNACYELQWFINSRTTLTQSLNAAVKQIYSLSTLLLFYFTVVLLLAQVAGLAFILSYAGTLPIGLQFLLASVVIISFTAFKIMH